LRLGPSHAILVEIPFHPAEEKDRLNLWRCTRWPTHCPEQTFSKKQCTANGWLPL